MQVAKSKYDQLKYTCYEISDLTSSLSSNEIIFFETISINVKFNHPELCFHNLVSWLYILYHEYSAKNIDFIRKKIISYKIPMAENGVLIFRSYRASDFGDTVPLSKEILKGKKVC